MDLKETKKKTIRRREEQWDFEPLLYPLPTRGLLSRNVYADRVGRVVFFPSMNFGVRKTATVVAVSGSHAARANDGRAQTSAHHTRPTTASTTSGLLIKRGLKSFKVRLRYNWVTFLFLRSYFVGLARYRCLLVELGSLHLFPLRCENKRRCTWINSAIRVYKWRFLSEIRFGN